jgi:archaellum component FlaC
LEQKRQNYHENKEKHKKRQRRQYLKHRSKRLQDAAVYRFENKEKISEGQKKWYHKNKDTKIEKDTKYKRKRRKVDVNHNLIIILRDRLSKAISGDYKKGSAVSDLGCSIDELEKENRKLKEELEIAQKDIRDFEVLAIEWKKGHSDLERKHRIEVGNLEQTICELVKELRD